MSNYFELLPEELITLVIIYIEEYEDLKNLDSSLSNIGNNTFDRLFTNKNFWLNLFSQKFGYLIDYISLPFLHDRKRRLDFYHILYFYVNASKSYNSMLKYVIEINDRTSKELNKIFPGITLKNIDLENIEETEIYEKISSMQVSSYSNGKYLTDISLIFDIEDFRGLHEQKDILANQLTVIPGIDNISMNRGFFDYSTTIYYSFSEVSFTYRLLEKEFKGFVFHLLINGFAPKSSNFNFHD